MFEYKTVLGTGLPNHKQFDELSEEGWELVQIIPYVEGMTDISKGEVAIYFRRKIDIQ